MASTTKNFKTNKKDLKTISKQPNEKTNSMKSVKNDVKKSTESIKHTKLEELKQDAHVAQRSREEREDERRKRIDELRMRNNDRRNKVEEKKRLIFEAEREKQRAILRKSQEIEARIEAKRNKEMEEKKKKKKEKSSTPVAFGSSTPRMLCLNDTNGSFCSSCWAIVKDSNKRQASISLYGYGRKFNEGYNSDGRSDRSNSFNFSTPNKRNDQIRSIRTQLKGTSLSESIRVSSLKGFARLTRNSDGETTPVSSRSRSNSSVSQQSSSTNSMDSCNVKLHPRTIVNRQWRSLVNSSIPVAVKSNRFSSDTKLTPIKSPLPKIHSTPKETFTVKSKKLKKCVTSETLEIEEKEEEKRLMEETIRLANEMLQTQKQKLKMVIEETERWEEEERKKQEERARKKREKEEAEKRAMEKAEKQRIEFLEKLKKSEEERLARRKRVEIIMLRTRG